MGRVEIGQTNVLNGTLGAQRSKLGERIQISGVLKRPPMELHQVNALGLHTLLRTLHACTHQRWCHRARLRAPFGEGFDG